MQGNFDPDDDWSRFRQRLLDHKQELMAQVCAGGLDLRDYDQSCGRILEIDAVLELARAVRRREDLQRPPQREPLRSPEE